MPSSGVTYKKMDLQKFDSTLKSALDNIVVPFDPSTWAALESRLDKLPAPDAVDKAVRPALERIETAYDSGTWSVLAFKMDTLIRVRRLRMTKLVEAAIFLLLLLNLKGFFGVVDSTSKPVPAKKEVPGPVAESHPSKFKKQVTNQDVSSSALVENLSIAQQLVSIVESFAATLVQTVDPDFNSISANTPQPIASNTSLLDQTNFYTQSGIVKFPVGTNLPSQPIEPVLFANSTISIPGIEIPKVVKPSRFYAATSASFDKNHLRQGTYRDKKTGYSGGLAVGYRKGKIGVETGLVYAQKTYSPEPDRVEYAHDPFSGISFFTIDEVNADVFSVPLKTTLRIAKLGKTSAHAVAGISAHFAASKTYGYQTKHEPPSPPTPNPAPDPPIYPLPNGKGVLEKGGLTSNAYATVDVGLRVEHPIGKRYVAFVEPAYRQSLGGALGPVAAQLSTFSLQAGVMASL